MARVVAVSSAKNQARSGKHLPAAASSCVDPQTAQRTHVSRTHTRTFAGTHMKTRRIVRLCIITLRTAASRRISAHPRPPTRPIGRPLQPIFRDFFPNRLDHGRVFNWFRPRILCTNSFLGPKGESEMTKISPLEGLQGRKKEFLPWDLKGELLPWSSQRAAVNSHFEYLKYTTSPW